MAAGKRLSFDPIEEARRQWDAHGWSEASAGMAMVTSIMRAHQVLMGRVDRALAGLHLSFARYEVLMLLLFSRKGALPLGKVGARLQVHPASVTNAVNRLEADGLLRRVPHPTDRRTTLAEITPEGRELARRATEALNAEVFSTTGLTPRQLDQLFQLVRRLRAAEGDFDENGSGGAG
ncbi:MAG TPA: MarR family transcriptional regulator [Acidimicrobiales bacterium]